MALPNDELRNRIRAAAALHGMGMRQLRDALEDYGADRTLAEAMVRGDTPQSPRNVRDLAETLGVPQYWFQVEKVSELFAPAASTEATDLADQARERAARALAKGRQQSHTELPATHPNGEAE